MSTKSGAESEVRLRQSVSAVRVRQSVSVSPSPSPGRSRCHQCVEAPARRRIRSLCFCALASFGLRGPRDRGLASLVQAAIARSATPKEDPVFIALSVSIEIISALRPVVARLKRVDKSLADQIRRAASSVSLNLAEGAKRTGADQLHFYRVAAGSNAEVRAALAVGDAWGHLDGIDASPLRVLLDREAALLHRLARPRV